MIGDQDEPVELTPHVGVGPLLLGMSESEARAILGSPRSSRRTRKGEIEHSWRGVRICFALNGAAEEISLAPPARPVYRGHELFAEHRLIQLFSQEDPEPKGGFGIVVFLGLGIAISGAETGEPDQPSVTLFSPGRWDNLSPPLRPIGH